MLPFSRYPICRPWVLRESGRPNHSTVIGNIQSMARWISSRWEAASRRIPFSP